MSQSKEVNKLILNQDEYFVYNRIENTRSGKYEGRELVEYTWEDLNNKILIGDFDDIFIGDYKPIIIDGITYNMTIAGIDTYKNIIKDSHHIDFISREVYKNNNEGIIFGYGSRGSDWNNGSNDYEPLYTNYGGTNSLYSYLTETFYNKIPSDVKNFLKDKELYMECRGNGTYSSTNSRPGILGKIWIPTEYELFGKILRGTKKYSAGNQIQYPIYINNPDFMNPHLSEHDPISTKYWLATAEDGNSNKICSYDIVHGGITADGSTTKNLIIFGFRI